MISWWAALLPGVLMSLVKQWAQHALRLAAGNSARTTANRSLIQGPYREFHPFGIDGAIPQYPFPHSGASE